MKLPQIKEANRYIGLYVVDFGDHSAVGFTAEEVAELLDSDANRNAHVYKIHNAYPDGRMELKGVTHETFDLEAGMFFYARSEEAGRLDFSRLCELEKLVPAPARAKVHFASDNNGGFVTALIYPAEYDDAFSRWLLDGSYRTQGAVEAGTNAVQRYYDAAWQILDRHQLWNQTAIESLQGQALQEAARKAIVR
jgi:hypothetical protein